MKHWLVVIVVAVLGCSRDPGAAPAGTGTETGAGSGAPKVHPRLISLTPSATEVVAALGATADLVGVDDYSTYPTEVAKLPKVGSFLAPNLETIVGLKPTLVVVDDVHGQTAAALGDAGIPTLECAMHALPDVKRALVQVGDKLGRAEAARTIVARIDAALDAAAAHKPARRPRVLAIIDREAGGLGGLVAAGTGSWIDELLAVVGAENVLAAAPVRYPKIALEEVLRTKPEIILDLSWSAKAGIEPWQALDVPAVKSGRVIALNEPYLSAPSPRVEAALGTLAKAITAPAGK